jgi:hypothetical protein
MGGSVMPEHPEGMGKIAFSNFKFHKSKIHFFISQKSFRKFLMKNFDSEFNPEISGELAHNPASKIPRYRYRLELEDWPLVHFMDFGIPPNRVDEMLGSRMLVGDPEDRDSVARRIARVTLVRSWEFDPVLLRETNVRTYPS